MLPLSLPHKLYSSFSQVLCSQDCLMRCSSHRLHTLSLILSLSLSLFICLPVLFRLKVCCLWLSMAIHKCICKPHSLPLSSNTCSSLSSTLCQIYLSFSPDLSIRSNVKQQDRAQRLNTLCFAFFFFKGAWIYCWSFFPSWSRFFFLMQNVRKRLGNAIRVSVLLFILSRAFFVSNLSLLLFMLLLLFVVHQLLRSYRWRPQCCYWTPFRHNDRK